ncbi:ABC transporter permease [Bifidobacterium choloepi]|uniref:ABC transporter permease n=1 Tax=Bifidobacterium choloepi TaxID=2614131 RepID=A0A6I5NGG6_9BIFI|nr:ABC transporter permease [Bifidobacterium choloepi]NEG69463.1 ABC transporter permease [Bifidobacterium choloepi]
MKFTLQRLGLLVVALAVVSVLIFAAIRVLPGDVAAVMAGMNASPARIAALRAELGLDEPLVVQYLSWLKGVVTGDFGTSMLTGQPIAAIVAGRAAVTFPLILLGLAIALVLGISLGCAAVLARRCWVRSLLQAIAVVGGAVPALWAGLLLILLLGSGTGVLSVLPTQGFPQDGWASPGRALTCLVLPALTVGIIVGASIMRYTRSALLDVETNGDVIALAMACGMTRRRAMVTVGLRLATPQLVSVVGLTFAEMITGVMVVENLFALPGIGTGLVTDIGQRDLIAVQGELLMLAAFFLVVGFAVDVAHRTLDPRLERAA